MRFSLFILPASLSLMAFGCGSSTPQPVDPNAGGQFQAGGQAQPGAYPGQAAQPGAYPGQAAQPGGYAAPGGYQPTPAPAGQPGAQPAASGGSATAIPAAAAMAGTPILMAMAASESQGAQQDGAAFAGQFQEGQTLEQAINIQPNKCYTVIAVGVGIQELHIQLVAQPAPMLPAIPLAQDNGTSANPVLGGKASGCWRNPTPLGGPGKVIIKATRGSGLALAQVYSK